METSQDSLYRNEVRAGVDRQESGLEVTRWGMFGFTEARKRVRATDLREQETQKIKQHPFSEIWGKRNLIPQKINSFSLSNMTLLYSSGYPNSAWPRTSKYLK